MTPKLKKIIIVAIILGILFIVYALFIKPDPAKTDLVKKTSATKTTTAEAQALGDQITQALQKIEKITLSKAIFSSDIYKSLVDRSQIIVDQPRGRSNPFAPLTDTSVNLKLKNSTSTQVLNPNATTTPKTATSTAASSTRPN